MNNDLTFKINVSLKDFKYYSFHLAFRGLYKFVPIFFLTILPISLYSVITSLIEAGITEKIFSAALSHIVFVSIFWFPLIFPILYIKKIYKNDDFLQSTVTYTFYDEKITISTPSLHTEVTWNKINKVFEDKKNIIITSKINRILILPKNQITDKVNEITDKLLKNIDKKKIKLQTK